MAVGSSSEEGHLGSSVICSQVKAFLLAKAKSLELSGSMVHTPTDSGAVYGRFRSGMEVPYQQWPDRSGSLFGSDELFSYIHIKVCSILDHNSEMLLNTFDSSFSGFEEADLNCSAHQMWRMQCLSRLTFQEQSSARRMES